ncbi:nucleotidyltransferase family protein [Myxococcaceae bacterium JPH2]|nr:nucleotidyltransferase family protein [Myxococcaceae bacterium JPH2]
MSTEGGLALVSLLRAWPAAPAASVAPEHAVAFVQASVRHGLVGFVEHAVSRAGWTLPNEARALLRRESLGNAARVMRVKALLAKAVKALASEGVTPVLLKGYGLARRLYPDPLQRATSDVDLLVTRAEVDRSVRALTGLGLRIRGPAHAHEDSHHLELTGAAGLVELHFRALAGYGRALEGDALVARSEVEEWDGLRVRHPNAEDEAVYLALHASNHLLQRLAWLFDLKLLALPSAARAPLDWAEVVSLARETALPHLAWYAWEAAHRLMAAPVPADVLSALAPPWWQREVAARCFSEARLLSTGLAKSKPAWMAAKLLLAPHVGDMARYTLRRLEAAARARLDGFRGNSAG